MCAGCNITAVRSWYVWCVRSRRSKVLPTKKNRNRMELSDFTVELAAAAAAAAAAACGRDQSSGCAEVYLVTSHRLELSAFLLQRASSPSPFLASTGNMVLSKKLLTLGSLVVSSVALPSSPSQRPLGDDDDNDTPLPLIIWHGKLRRCSASRLTHCLTAPSSRARI